MTVTEVLALSVALVWASCGVLAGARWGGCFGGLAGAAAAGFAGLVVGYLFYDRLNSVRPYTPPADGSPDTWRKVRAVLSAAGWGLGGIVLNLGPAVAAVIFLRLLLRSR